MSFREDKQVWWIIEAKTVWSRESSSELNSVEWSLNETEYLSLLFKFNNYDSPLEWKTLKEQRFLSILLTAVPPIPRAEFVYIAGVQYMHAYMQAWMNKSRLKSVHFI